VKIMRLRYAGTCSACGSTVGAGETAGYDAGAKAVTCTACLARTDVEVDRGSPGASARVLYERKAARRERRIRTAHPRLGGLILALTDEPQSTRAWATGGRGESYLGAKLDAVPNAIVLHDRQIPGSKANIDHIAVAASGVCVIDAKNYTGRIELRSTGPFGFGDKRLYVGRRDCTSLAEKMPRQINAVRRALAGLEEAQDVPITGVLCFVKGDWPLLFPPDRYADVLIEGEGSTCRWLANPGPVGPQQRDVLARQLALQLPAA
jgi:hypothetical protein